MTEAQEKWTEALRLVIAGREPKVVAPIVAVSPITVGRWLNGHRVPCGWMWRALVLEAGMGDCWAELSGLRDAVAQKPGRKRTTETRRRQAERLREKAAALEAGK